MIARGRARGQALVEFALIAPLFMVLFIGLADIGRGFLAYVELSMGSRAAARQAVLEYNAKSNSGSLGCLSPCSAPGVDPIISRQAGFGFPVVDDSVGPTNVTQTNDPSWAANGDAPPYDLTLSSSAATNTIYVFTYEYDPTSTTRAARWPTSASARDSGYQMVVVDLKLKWTSVTLSLLGISPTLTLDAQTVQRIEY